MSEIRRTIEPYLARLRRYAWTLTRDASRADDLVQNCVLRALTNQHLWREGTDLRAWLFAILHNQYISDVRRGARERECLTIANLSPAILPGSDPEMACHVRELRDALDRLPDGRQEIVLRIGLGAERYDDVASDLGLPVGTVRSRLSRARESLRGMMDR